MPVFIRSDRVSRGDGFSQNPIIRPSRTITEPYSPESRVRQSSIAQSQPLFKNLLLASLRSKSNIASPEMTNRQSWVLPFSLATAPALPRDIIWTDISQVISAPKRSLKQWRTRSPKCRKSISISDKTRHPVFEQSALFYRQILICRGRGGDARDACLRRLKPFWKKV